MSEEGQDERRIILAHVAPPHRPRLLWALLRRTRRRCLRLPRRPLRLLVSGRGALLRGGALHLGVPGSGRRAQSEGISAAALSLAKACAVICIVIALIAMARVAITSAAASCALETRSLQTSIETARAEGNELEVSQSVLANPSRIKAQATALGMAAPAPECSEQITLSPDIVATDGAGSLSLSESVARMKGL